MESFSATIQHGHHKPTVERRGKIGGWGWGGTLALGVGSGQTSDTRCLYSRDNIAEHSALFTFSHLMQSEGPFHDKRSPFFSESLYFTKHLIPMITSSVFSFSILKIRVEVLVLFFSAISYNFKHRSIWLKLHIEHFSKAKTEVLFLSNRI